MFRLQDLPPEHADPALTMKQPEIYYGESNDVPFVVTNTSITEDNSAGRLDRPVRRQGRHPALELHPARDVRLEVSATTTCWSRSSITAESKILINRDIQTRIRKPVPFLGFDSDPYFAIVDGQPEWIWDAYTYTDQYPYSQAVDVGDATGGLLAGQRRTTCGTR